MRQVSWPLRLSVLAVLWLICSALQFVDSVLVLMLWPLSMILFAAAVITAASGLRHVWELRETISSAGFARGILLGILVSAAIAAAGSMTPSRSLYGAYVATVPISPVVGPSILVVVGLFALHAVRRPSPRRLASLALAGVSAWPFLTAIRAYTLLRSDYPVIEPSAMLMLSLGTVVISGLALVCGALAWQTSTDAPAPPVARALRAR